LESFHSSWLSYPKVTDRVQLAGQVVLLGYGSVGRRIATALSEKSIAMIIVDQNKSVIESLSS
jgi:CPA2 family monovalent cation:H+ antiporter-2